MLISKENLYTTLTAITLVLVILQTPFFYYTSGAIAFYGSILYVLTGLILTILVTSHYLGKPETEQSLAQKIAITAIISIGSIGFLLGDRFQEEIDWSFRKDKRQKIVELIKNDKLKLATANNLSLYDLDNTYTLPLSNNGNQVAVYKNGADKLSVEFYIKRVSANHYSAFLYTNDDDTIKNLETKIALKKYANNIKKLDEHWYRVSY